MSYDLINFDHDKNLIRYKTFNELAHSIKVIQTNRQILNHLF